MTLVISKGITLAKATQPLDADAQAYVNAVEVADGQRIEDPVRFAINNFVIGCKADGIWTAIKASCILAGARTRLGALTPLVGTAPTSFNFVNGDYNRKTGLVGDASTKYLNSNRNNNADPQDDRHLAIYMTSLNTSDPNRILAGSTNDPGRTTLIDRGTLGVAIAGAEIGGLVMAVGLVGGSRATSSAITTRTNGISTTTAVVSASPHDAMLGLFNSVPVTVGSSPRLAFYSIGESLNLALLDARVTDLINAFGAAIP
jgi:hypothetical protein